MLKRFLKIFVMIFLFSGCGENGKDGLSCSVKDNNDGTKTIICDDGTEAIISDGTNGADGTDGADGNNGANGTDGTDGADGTNGTDGADGTDGKDGSNGVCAGNTPPEIVQITINGSNYGSDPVVAGHKETLEVAITATDLNEDDLSFVIAGSGALIEETDLSDGVKTFSLTLDSEGILNFSLIVSDGCQMTVKNFVIDACTENFPYAHKGKCWSPAAPNTMNFSNSKTYCDNLGGRMPNIQELRMLVQNCPKVEYPQPVGQDPWCNVEDPGKLQESDRTGDCLPACTGEINIFGLSGGFWSSSLTNTMDSFCLFLSSGDVYWRNMSETDTHVLCVRD